MNGKTQKPGPSCVLLALSFVTALSGCQGGRAADAAPSDLVQQASDPCQSPETDYRKDSLPWYVNPRPGPDVLYAEPAFAPQLENAGVWQAAPILISGADAYRCGEYVYQDWLYDDHGAAGVLDVSDPQGVTAYLFSPKAGTLTYPTAPEFANNAADIVELRIKPLADATALRVTMNTLLDPDVLGISLALGEGEVTAWPHAAGVQSPAAYFVTVQGAVAEMLSATGEEVEPQPSVAIDLERRQIEIRIPHNAWNPGRDTVRIAAGAGLWDAEAGQYRQAGLIATQSAPGGGGTGAALFNMAFRFDEPMPAFAPGSGRTIADTAVLTRLDSHWWREYAQADALRRGDVSAFHTQVDFAKLADAINDESRVPQTGPMNRIFASRFSFGQGVDYASECGGVSAARPCDGAMLGQLQPYAIYVPQSSPPDDGYSLTLLLHALTGNVNQYLGSRHQQQLGERGEGSIVVTPAGRGPDGFYFDVAEADTFEVWADVARLYHLNPDRVAMTGISMGGIGSFRLAARYPDLFGRIMPVVAAASDYLDLLPSLRNVPVMMWTALLDELQNVVWTEETIAALADLGYRLDVWRFETWDHLTSSTNDHYQPGADFLLLDRVERNPVQVTYVLKPAEDESRVDVIADKAYWLSDMRLRDVSLASGKVDAITEGLGRAPATPLALAQTIGIYSGGHHEPAPYTQRVYDWAEAPSQQAADRLHISVSNIGQLTVHPQRAGLTCSAELLIESDGPIDVQLAGCE